MKQYITGISTGYHVRFNLLSGGRLHGDHAQTPISIRLHGGWHQGFHERPIGLNQDVITDWSLGWALEPHLQPMVGYVRVSSVEPLVTPPARHKGRGRVLVNGLGQQHRLRPEHAHETPVTTVHTNPLLVLELQPIGGCFVVIKVRHGPYTGVVTALARERWRVLWGDLDHSEVQSIVVTGGVFDKLGQHELE